jgi:hypothetical protein
MDTRGRGILAIAFGGAVEDDSEKGGEGGVARSEAMEEVTDFAGGVATVGEEVVVDGEFSILTCGLDSEGRGAPRGLRSRSASALRSLSCRM